MKNQKNDNKKSNRLSGNYPGTLERCKGDCRIGDVASWSIQNFKGSASKKGDLLSVQFGETFSDFEIIESVPDQKIVWQVLDCNLHWMKDKKEWKVTRILWEIVSMGEDSEIHLTHIGLNSKNRML